MRFLFIPLVLLLLLQSSFAQVSPPITPSKAGVDYYKKYHHRKPSMPALLKHATMPSSPQRAASASSIVLPENVIYPAEFEEMQAVLVTWPYITQNAVTGGYAEPVFENKGVNEINLSTFATISTLDTMNLTELVSVFYKLINGIQAHAEAWITLYKASDTTILKTYFANQGTPLYNYRFFITAGNSFWYRDCGPVAFYYGVNADSLAFMDFEYYGGRPLDDRLPIVVGGKMDIPVYTNSIEYEGGNILMDGARSLYTSSAVYELNADRHGLFVEDTVNHMCNVLSKTPLTKIQVQDSLRHLLNLTRIKILPKLNYDGGTGHIDLYTDLWDENTFVSTKHPEVLARSSDARKIAANMDTLTSLLTMHNQPYANTHIPLPRKDNGSWYASEVEYNQNYTRSYSNHLILNNAIIQPVFNDGVTGDVVGDNIALDSIRKQYPGYEIIPIDIRSFDGFGGAIHCITKEIPAKNPLRIHHSPHRGVYWTGETPQLTFSAIAQNASGISSVSLFYRSKNTTAWNEIPMTAMGDNLYTYQMHLSTIAASLNMIDTMEYYIAATSVNGKTITKPFTAPKGYYSFVYGNDQSLSISNPILGNVAALEQIGQCVPNPAKDYTHITFPAGLSNVEVQVIDVFGRLRSRVSVADSAGEMEINTHGWSSGVYWVIFSQGGQQAIRKLMVP